MFVSITDAAVTDDTDTDTDPVYRLPFTYLPIYEFLMFDMMIKSMIND